VNVAVEHVAAKIGPPFVRNEKWHPAPRFNARLAESPNPLTAL
jgi:hypothetical protein